MFFSFSVRIPRQFCFDQTKIINRIQQCLDHIIFYCSPITFSGLMKVSFGLLNHCVKMSNQIFYIHSFIPSSEICDEFGTGCSNSARLKSPRSVRPRTPFQTTLHIRNPEFLKTLWQSNSDRQGEGMN